MASKTIDIDVSKIQATIKNYVRQIISWVNHFLKTMDAHETYALIGMGVGLVLLIIGIIIV